MTSNDTRTKSREAFEQWKKGPHGLGLGLSRNNTPGSDLDGYQDFFSQGQWDAWQAAESRMQAKIDAAVLAEREECKEICEQIAQRWGTAADCADEIDARTTNNKEQS